MQDFHTKLPCHNPILIQIEWDVQSGLIKKLEFYQQLHCFFENFVSVYEPFIIKSQFDIPVTQMSIFKLFDFYLWVLFPCKNP